MWKQCDGDSADDTPKNLNRLYLYFDTLDIERKHNLVYSTEQINRTVTELGKLDQEAVRLQNQGLTEDSKEVKQLKYDVICLLKQLSKSLDSQIEALISWRRFTILRSRISACILRIFSRMGSWIRFELSRIS